jgi:hypothetical protein
MKEWFVLIFLEERIAEAAKNIDKFINKSKISL